MSLSLFGLSKASEEARLEHFQERLFSVASIPEEKAVHLLASSNSNALFSEFKARDDLLNLWRKWSFGEHFGTMTEVAVFENELQVRSTTFEWSASKSPNSKEPKKFRKVPEEIRKPLIAYFTGILRNPLPLSVRDEFPYSSGYGPGDGVDIIEEAFRKGEQPRRWGIRSAFLTGIQSNKAHTKETLELAKSLQLPSF